MFLYLHNGHYFLIKKLKSFIGTSSRVLLAIESIGVNTSVISVTVVNTLSKLGKAANVCGTANLTIVMTLMNKKNAIRSAICPVQRYKILTKM